MTGCGADRGVRLRFMRFSWIHLICELLPRWHAHWRHEGINFQAAIVDRVFD